jgi:hypothetical protein
VSAITVASLMKRSMSMNSAIGFHFFVFLLTMKPAPMPQFGWQPHFIVPQSAPGPFSRSVTSASGPIAESGNQSRSGSVAPVCACTSCARCDSV